MWLSTHSGGEDSSFLYALYLGHMAGPELSVLFISKVPALSLWHSQMFAKALYWLQLLILIQSYHLISQFGPTFSMPVFE